METFQILREEAKKQIFKADHMLTMTYPLIQEPKILVNVARNILEAVEKAMTAILEYEKTFKKIHAYQNTFEYKLNILKNQIGPRYNIPIEHLRLLQDLKEIMTAHKKSPIEFSRKDKFVICSDAYEIRTLTKEDLKRMISKAKVFITLANNLTTQNEGIFR